MTSYNANPAVIDHIAALVFQARPSWDPMIVRVVLNAHAQQVDGTDLAIAALRAAKNERFLTAKAIGWRGPHWDGLGTQPPDVARDSARCSTCGKIEPRCYGERPGLDDDHLFEPIHLVSR